MTDYELPHPTDAGPWALRENLAATLENELLGPAGGETEVLNTRPDTVYLIGRIAPRRISDREHDPETDPDDGEPADGQLGTALDARLQSGLPVNTVDDTPEADDDDVHDQPQRRGLMIPASMGLRFQLPLDVPAFTVHASWGRYKSRNHETDNRPDGSPKRVFERTPMNVTRRIATATLVDGRTTSVELDDTVMLRIDTHTDGDRRLVEVALCNDKDTPSRIPVHAWMFQTQLHVETDGSADFLPVRDPMLDSYAEPDDEIRLLDLQYRNRLEYAIGRTCSVSWHADPAARRASRVWTTWLPKAETPPTEPLDDPAVTTDMRALADAGPDQLRAGLTPIADGYADWITKRAAEAATLPQHLRGDADEAIAQARAVLAQLRAGIDTLLTDAEARRCFAFMNQVMADQRVHSEIVRQRAQDPSLSYAAAVAAVQRQGVRAHSWRLFQLAFVLMQLPALCDPTLPRRSGSVAEVELLFFPTGGGKTEAYLGLAAFAFAIRRRQGVLDTPDGPLDGTAGLTVLMRYTLRLLTAQQFQRATTMVCAAELLRQQQPDLWGTEPFRIGLWVGSQVSPKTVLDAKEQVEAAHSSGYSSGLTVLQVRRCPWCGTTIGAGQVTVDETLSRVLVHCGDPLATCPFAEGGQVDEGLPVLTTDEEIYRLAPAYLIATVDKFARLAREGSAASLFGYVTRRCERHGFVHPDYRGCTISDASAHQAKGGHPSARARPAKRLRPPDLIIQDELHLITGALGTTVGLFELAIDAVTTWRTPKGNTAKPLIVASSATVRNAVELVRNLYGRNVTIFPPQVLDVADTHFSKEVEPSPANPGRLYVGVSTSGVRLTNAEIRVSEILMAGAQLLLDTAGDAADPYLTLVGYFGSIRELGGMKRYLGDDVQTALDKTRPWSKLPRRPGTIGALHIDELTSRASSTDITDTLDQLAVPFSSEFDSAHGRRARAVAHESGQPVPKRDKAPYDAVLATSMLQVGVDVPRLGLMLMVGQPKNTAEYIQASSRVGRSKAGPGLVVTLGNWARPRDLSHYEQFEHYHDTFYARVEALSVTPFSETSIERGLDGVLVSALRVLQAIVPDGLSPEKNAGHIGTQLTAADRLVDALVARTAPACSHSDDHQVRLRLQNRLDLWQQRRDHAEAHGRVLVYEKAKDNSEETLLISAENARNRAGGLDLPPFVVANSMREVQPEINILVSPDPKRLFLTEPAGAPRWQPPTPKAD